MTSGYRVIGYRVMAKRLLIIALLGVSGTSCRLGKITEPDLTGPSGFGVSLALSATPDLLPRDGRATSTVTMSAYSGSSKPVPGLGLHLELNVIGGTGGLGTLSQRDVTTGSDGRASVTYLSPERAPLAHADDATVQIVVTPVGSNASSSSSSAITIRLTSPDQAGGPTASFTFGPKEPKIGYTILFDASASRPSAGSTIVQWFWDFDDGNSNPRQPYLSSNGPTFTHEYNKSGPFTVGLTVLDSAGRRSTATFVLTVVE